MWHTPKGLPPKRGARVLVTDGVRVAIGIFNEDGWDTALSKVRFWSPLPPPPFQESQIKYYILRTPEGGTCWWEGVSQERLSYETTQQW